jgi:hypothetical protein
MDAMKGMCYYEKIKNQKSKIKNQKSKSPTSKSRKLSLFFSITKQNKREGGTWKNSNEGIVNKRCIQPKIYVDGKFLSCSCVKRCLCTP